jgi:hypothetical protein
MALLLHWVSTVQGKRALLPHRGHCPAPALSLFATICKRIPEKCNKVLWLFLQDLYLNASRYFRSAQYKHVPFPISVVSSHGPTQAIN